jgi:hypothetical protein
MMYEIKYMYHDMKHYDYLPRLRRERTDKSNSRQMQRKAPKKKRGK